LRKDDKGYLTVRGEQLQFGLHSAPSRPQAVHRSRDPIAGTSISSDKFDTSTIAEWWQSMR
jgi:hypothetical protein